MGASNNAAGVTYEPLEETHDDQPHTCEETERRDEDNAIGLSDIMPEIRKEFSSTSQEGGTELREVPTGGPDLSYVGHSGTVNGCAIFPDGTHVITASEDGTARIWDATSGELVHVLEGHESSVRSCAVFPDGTRVLTAGHDSTARVWDASTGTQLSMFTGHGGPLFSCAVFPDGVRALSISVDAAAVVWDSNTGEPLFTLDAPEDPRERRLPVGHQAAIGQQKNKEDDCGDGKVAGAGHHCCAISKDGSRILLVGGDDGKFTVSVFDDTGAQIHELDGPCCFAVAIVSATLCVALCESWTNHTAVVFDYVEAEELCTFKPDKHSARKGSRYLNACVGLPGSQLIAVGGDDGILRVFRHCEAERDPEEICVFAMMADGKAAPTQVRALAAFPDGKRILACGGGGMASVWRLPE